MEAGGKAAPTGCYKCGRPGHWSRDCPDSDPDPNPNLNPNPNPDSNAYSSRPSNPFPSSSRPAIPKSAAEKPKKVPKTRPKLSDQLLLGDDGIGYVLRHFPRNFRYRGRGHEVDDLGNLIGFYREWHSHLLPYYSFDQFVYKVEQVAASKRIKRCINDLRDKIDEGKHPNEAHEESANVGEDPADAENCEGMHEEEGLRLRDPGLHVEQEEILREVYDKSVQESPRTSIFNGSSQNEQNGTSSSHDDITEEQKARIAANRLKALERAAARAQMRQ